MQDFTLSARERGYRQPGKKLLPRDAYMAMECERMKCSRRTYMQFVAAEVAHNERQYPREQHERRYNRVLDSLSGRWRRMFERRMQGTEFPAPNYPHEWPRPLRRAYDATVEFEQIERCIQYDRNLWANAQ